MTRPSGGGVAAAHPDLVEVHCPKCSMPTMVTPGLASVCFSCGEPLSADLSKATGLVEHYPLTGAMEATPHKPPPNPYGDPVCAVLSGGGALYTIKAGEPAKVGRDPRECAVTLNDSKVSAVHAMLRWEGAKLWVRDEGSNNGTFVDALRLNPGDWVPVRAGATLRFGPIEFNVRYE
jgi:hypothetical protein